MLELDSYFNLSIGALVKSRRWTVSRAADHRRLGEATTAMSLRGNPGGAIGLLSGGNHQKVLLARLLVVRLAVLLLDEPTRGVDIDAKKEIWELLEALAADGTAILMASSELPEVLRLSDCILVLADGRVAGEFPAGTPQKRLLRAALPAATQSATLPVAGRRPLEGRYDHDRQLAACRRTPTPRHRTHARRVSAPSTTRLVRRQRGPGLPTSSPTIPAHLIAGDNMRALVLTDWWKLDVEEVEPLEPGAGDVVIDVVATGICGSDIHGYTGENGRRSPGQVMGHETVGRVAHVGADVRDRPDLTVGAAVTVNPVLNCGVCAECRAGQEQSCPTKSVIGVDPTIRSAFADQLTVRASNVVPLPPGVPLELGALVEPLAVGYHALRRGGCSSADTVLVIGGGPIGQACVLAAQRLGAQAVVVSEPDAGRRQLNAGLGAAAVDPTGVEALTDLVTGALGGAPSLVVDAVGSSRTLGSALEVAPLGGRVVLVGMGAQRLDLAAYAISVSERTVIGSFCYSASEFSETALWIAEEPDKLATLVQGRVGVEAGNESFEALAKGESEASKILVFFNGEEH